MNINEQNAWDAQDETQNYGSGFAASDTQTSNGFTSDDSTAGEDGELETAYEPNAEEDFDTEEDSGTEDELLTEEDSTTDDSLIDDDDDLVSDDDALADEDDLADDDDESLLDDTEGGAAARPGLV